MWILELGRRHVPYPAHRWQQGLVEKRRLAVGVSPKCAKRRIAAIIEG